MPKLDNLNLPLRTDRTLSAGRGPCVLQQYSGAGIPGSEQFIFQTQKDLNVDATETLPTNQQFSVQNTTQRITLQNAHRMQISLH